MKISLNWVKEFTDVKLSVDKLAEKIGAQLGEVEEVIDLGEKYRGIVVAKVITCEKHPDADKLSVCTIDDGGVAKGINRTPKGLVQVVCGAPNVKAGLLVAWLPPGAVVPSTFDKDQFKLEAREIRGVVSNGMLASAAELAISDDHTGILELDPDDGKPGDDFAKKFSLDDYIIEVENKMFTHRPDCFGILGVAREIAGISHQKFESPKWYLGDKTTGAHASDKNLLKVRNSIPQLVPRFMAQVVQGVEIKPSPVWLQCLLSKVGLKPINNVVDITNYVMYITGQPMHAYDYDKVGKNLLVRLASKGEKLPLLNGKEIKLDDKDIVITDGTKPIGLGGVMGGSETEVGSSTKNIILECATFDMYAIRRTSMRHGLFTDAVTRFNKGQSPYQNDRVMARAIGSIIHETGGMPARSIYDLKGKLVPNARVSVTADFVNERLGTRLSAKEMTNLLENVEFNILSVPADKKKFHVQPPFWRTDIEIPEDVVEEIGRLYGYDHLPLVLPERGLAPVEHDPLMRIRSEIRAHLASTGANELLTYSFVHGNLMEKCGQNKDNAFRLSNALSPDLQYFRMSLLPSLLDKVHPNIKSGYGEFALFEMNPVHNKDLTEDGLPLEEHRLGLVYAAEDKLASGKYAGAPYYQARKYLDNLLEGFGIDAVYEPASSHEPQLEVGKAAIAPFDRSRAAYVKTKDGKLLGEIGEFRSEVQKSLKLPKFAAGFELDVERLLAERTANDYIPLPRFPKVEQDISLSVKTEVSYSDLAETIKQTLIEDKPDEALLAFEPLDIFRKQEKPQKHVAFRVSIASYERTLTAGEVNELLDKAAHAAHEKFGAERI